MTNRDLALPNQQVELHDDTFRTMIELADRLHKSQFCPVQLKNAGQVLAVILTGRELGIGPMASLRNISIINQRASLSAELLAYLIKRDHGYDAIQFVAGTNDQATYRYKSRGMVDYAEYTYTMDMAKRAQLTGKDVWQKYPAEMLRARCVSGIARIAFQDVSLGLYTTEELEGIPVDTSADIQAEYTTLVTAPSMANELAADARRKGIDPRSEQYETYLTNDPDAGRIAEQHTNKPPAPCPPPDAIDPENGHARKVTQSQGRELTAVRKALEIDDPALKAIVIQRYDTDTLKNLNFHQMADLIAYLQSLVPEEESAEAEFEEI